MPPHLDVLRMPRDLWLIVFRHEHPYIDSTIMVPADLKHVEKKWGAGVMTEYTNVPVAVVEECLAVLEMESSEEAWKLYKRIRVQLERHLVEHGFLPPDH